MAVKYDVLGIGNAIMDVIAPVPDTVLAAENITKGAMTLIDEARALHLHTVLDANATNPLEIAGGSGANTVAGIAAMGVSSAYIGKVADDALGEKFTHSLRAEGVEIHTPPLKDGPATARCLIAVTPDGERSMSTFLGANTAFGPQDIAPDTIAAAALIYMEGYLFDTNAQKQAFIKAAEIAKAKGRQVALTLSDAFCVGRHRDAFLQLVDNHVDILFANEEEILSLYQTQSFDEAINGLKTTAAITRGEKGSLIIENGNTHTIKVVPVGKVIDTTGAGDQYAAGVLAARARGQSWAEAGALGSLCAAEVISHYGARPETDINQLAKSAPQSL